MQIGSVTTPFGRRQMTLALVRRQQALSEIREGKSVDKWKVFRDASSAHKELGIQSNSLAVLDALLSFYPEAELRLDAQLVVFPSNAQLSLRAHAMPGATLRRHLAILVEAGLIVRKDSANGKRYARKDGSGEIESAFGFDLSPLLARADELAIMAQQIAADRATFRKVKENLTIRRRDVRKLITAAIEEGAEGDWQAMEDTYVGLVRRIPRAPSTKEITEILEKMETLYQEVLNGLNSQEFSENTSTNADHIEQHIQNSKTESISEFEPSSRNEQGAKLSSPSVPLKSFPLGIVLKACPQMQDYGPGGTVKSWRDVMSAAIVVKSMLGISPSAYQDACEILGQENAAIAVACILERANFITSAGGYLRDLTRRTERGEFSLGPMLMAQLRANSEGRRKAG